MKITFLGHACFLMEDGTTKILTDPFLTGNSQAAARADEVEADFILVSHGHDDHVGDTISITKRIGAKVICPIELGSALFAPKGVEFLPGNIGGTAKLPFGSVKMVTAIHGSGVPGALACGFVVKMGGKAIYFAGDTALSMDMMLLKDERPDVALLPIGDVFTMGPDDAVRAVKMIEPALTIPMHYNTFSAIVQEGGEFAAKVESAGFACKVLKPGECMEL